MLRILDIAFKDLMQLSRDFKTFMFLLIMPIIFTFVFVWLCFRRIWRRQLGFTHTGGISFRRRSLGHGLAS